MDIFDNYFGCKVGHDGLVNNKLITLFDYEETQIKEGCKLKLQGNNGYITLGAELSSVGLQGIIYECRENPQYVIKIFKRDHRTTYVEKKINELLKFNNTNNQVCWPCGIVTFNKKFVGYLMPKVEGSSLRALANASAGRNYAGFSRKKQVEIILDVLDQFIYLHSKNILVGDVKLENIFFDKNTFAVTLIDMDSVQAGIFNSELTTFEYDPPEIIDPKGTGNVDACASKMDNGDFAYQARYRYWYRTLDNEYYAISVLLFKFLMLSHDPYVFTDYDENIDDCWDDEEIRIKFELKKRLAQDFPYSDNYKSTSKECGRKKIWSHFPSFLKEAFVDAFGKNGIRRSPQDWKIIFEKYLKLIDKRLGSIDAEYNSINPKNEADYTSLMFKINEVYEQYGFTMAQAVAKCIRKLGANELAPDIGRIVKELKTRANYTLDDKYQFALIYNIGVLKKVQVEVL